MGIVDMFGELTVLAYLLGSIPFGKIVGWRNGIDIQKHGSGNIGFMNVRRILGWKPGLIVLTGDVLKGFVPVLLATKYLPQNEVFIVGIAAVVGHVFPIWLKGKGGKGIATGLGVTIALNPLLGIIGGVLYLIALAYFKKSGPSSVSAAWSLPIICLAYWPSFAWLYAVLALLVSYTHRKNLAQQFLKV